MEAAAAVVGTGDKVEVELELELTKAEHQPEPDTPLQRSGQPHMAEQSPDFAPLTDNLSQSVRAACALMAPAEVIVSPPGCVLPENFVNYAKRIRDLPVCEDDIWIISFPKCGSQLMQEMVWLLGNNQDFEQAVEVPLYKRFVLLEYVALWPEGADQPDTVSWVTDMPSPRYIKSHLPLELLPTQLWTKRPKIIYVGRNPKDTALDYFNHYQEFYQFSGSQELFFEAFYHDRVVYSPFWEHVLGFWNMRKEPNLIILTYEEMSQNLKSVLKKTALFLGVTLDSEAEDKLVHYLEHNEVLDGSKNGVGDDKVKIRLGKVGSWRSNMNRSHVERFDRWTKEKLAGTDFSNVFMII